VNKQNRSDYISDGVGSKNPARSYDDLNRQPITTKTSAVRRYRECVLCNIYKLHN